MTSETFIVDAHLHLGSPGLFFTPESQWNQLLRRMDRLKIRLAVCTDHLSLSEGADAGMSSLSQVYEQTEGRVFYLGVYDPRRSAECLRALGQAVRQPGFAGLKIHPSFHRTPAEDLAYEPAWRFAADYDVAILTHSWSLSEYNASQRYSTPERFEPYIRQFPSVRLVLGHTGGRGAGRHEMARLVNAYPNVYTDFAGDIYCYRLIESLLGSIPDDRLLFGSDFPWFDPRAGLCRVFMARITLDQKKKILYENARNVYKLGANSC